MKRLHMKGTSEIVYALRWTEDLVFHEGTPREKRIARKGLFYARPSGSGSDYSGTLRYARLYTKIPKELHPALEPVQIKMELLP